MEILLIILENNYKPFQNKSNKNIQIHMSKSLKSFIQSVNP